MCVHASGRIFGHKDLLGVLKRPRDQADSLGDHAKEFGAEGVCAMGDLLSAWSIHSYRYEFCAPISSFVASHIYRPVYSAFVFLVCHDLLHSGIKYSLLVM